MLSITMIEKKQMVVGDLRRIGSGTYGTVFREVQDPSQVKATGGVVVKVFSALMSTELVVLHSIRHPHICARTGLVGVEVAEHIPVGVLMPRYSGDLATIPVDWRDAARYLSHARAGLDHLHSAGILHLDVSAGNLFIDLGARKMVIGDFGLSLLLPPGEIRVFNTLQRCSYPAPETGPQPCPPGCRVLAALPTVGTEPNVMGYVYTREVDFYGLGRSFYDAVVSRMRGGFRDRAKREFVDAVFTLMDKNPDRRSPPTSPREEGEKPPVPKAPAMDVAPPPSGDDILANFSAPTPAARRLLESLRCLCNFLMDWSPDVPLTLLAVLLDVLLRSPTPEDRIKRFPAAAYLAMAYTFQQEVSIESLAGVTSDDVAHMLLEMGGLIYDPLTARVTDRSSLRSAVATALSSRPVGSADPSNNRLPFYNCALAAHTRPRRRTTVGSATRAT